MGNETPTRLMLISGLRLSNYVSKKTEGIFWFIWVQTGRRVVFNSELLDLLYTKNKKANLNAVPPITFMSATAGRSF